jgi:hypothetical protein
MTTNVRLEGDEKTGLEIVRRAVESPCVNSPRMPDTKAH